MVYCDDAGNWSGSTQIKAGEMYVDVYQSNGVTRWGDYSGIARKQNGSHPEVWTSGCYGAVQSGENALNTWIAQITGLSIGIPPSGSKTLQPVSVYPNPSTGRVNVEFTMDKRSMVDISLVDAEGNTMKVLMKDMADEGKNRFSFNRGVLSPGIYFLRIASENKVLSNEKLVIE
jgi:hypothetical protein